MKLIHLAIAGAATVSARPGDQAAKDARQAQREQDNLDNIARRDAGELARQNLHIAKEAAKAAKAAAKHAHAEDKNALKQFNQWEREIRTMINREAQLDTEDEREGFSRTPFPMYGQASFGPGGDVSDTSGCHGDVWFKQTSYSNMLVWYTFKNCEGSHDHSFHIHANYDASKIGDCGSNGVAGGHYNPWGAASTADLEYITNMGNVMTDTNGDASGQASRPHYVRLSEYVNDNTGTHTSVVGRSIVVHGAGGARIGCGGAITMGAWNDDNTVGAMPVE